MRITSPVRRLRFSRDKEGLVVESSVEEVDGVRVTSSRKTAISWTGSLQRGPWAVASWKACAMRSEKSAGVREVDEVSISGAVDSVLVVSCKLHLCKHGEAN